MDYNGIELPEVEIEVLTALEKASGKKLVKIDEIYQFDESGKRMMDEQGFYIKNEGFQVKNGHCSGLCINFLLSGEFDEEQIRKIGNLRFLEILDLCGLKSLPPEICTLSSLKILTLEFSNFNKLSEDSGKCLKL